MVRRQVRVGVVATAFFLALTGCAEVSKTAPYPEPECVLLCALIRSLAGDAEPVPAAPSAKPEPQKSKVRASHKSPHHRSGHRQPQAAEPNASAPVPQPNSGMALEPPASQGEGWIQLPGSSPIEGNTDRFKPSVTP